VDYPRHKKAPKFQSKLRECPCGSPLPCPHHEALPEQFWFTDPQLTYYRSALTERDIPFLEPKANWA
jgi:hypothetical protein